MSRYIIHHGPSPQPSKSIPPPPVRESIEFYHHPTYSSSRSIYFRPCTVLAQNSDDRKGQYTPFFELKEDLHCVEGESTSEGNEREREAFDVQFRWLRAQAPTMRIFSLELAQLGPAPILPSCRQDGHTAIGNPSPMGQH